MRFIQYKLADQTSVASNFYSIPIDISSAVVLGLHAHIASGTATGKAFTQISCDPVNTTPDNWVTVGVGADLTGGATTAFEKQDVCANWMRLFWNHSAGTGTVTVHVKTIGY